MKITEALIAEHRIYLSVFEQIERVLPSLATPAELSTMAGIVEGLLQSHAARETNLAYLALDHALAEKGQLDRMHQDHAELDDRLRKIYSAPSCAQGRRLLQAALAGTREHFRHEERVVFPMMERVLKAETLIDLGRPWTERGGESLLAVKA